MTSKIAIEDEFNDIISKAMSGLRLSERELGAASGVSPETIRDLTKGRLDETSLPRIAPHLKLDPNALLRSALKSWRPRPVEIEGLELFNTDYRGVMTVNAYLVWDPASKMSAIFDTGTDAFPILDAIEERQLIPTAIYLTHTHPDHIAEVDSVVRRLNVPVYSSISEPYDSGEHFRAGETFELGALRIETRSTWGHSKGGITYVVHGLSRPLAIVGDAMFAGSMGGGMISYADALRTNREEIFTLSDETVICPGHGPLTSVLEEKKHNPFFPEFK